MDRTLARVLEAQKIAEIMEILLNSIDPNVSVQTEHTIPRTARGKGMIDTTRGALGHWLKINPVEAGRIVRSFDPCISCATH